MKVQVPEALKADLPPTTWNKIMTATPVVMAVVATMLAGLASSEMTKAQYERALAAQQQSKAGDQWSFFQAKRLRGALQRNTADLLQATAPVERFSVAAAKSALGSEPSLIAALDSPAGKQAAAVLETGEMVRPKPAQAPDPAVKAALEGVETSRPSAEMAALLAKVNDPMLESTLRSAQDVVASFDAEVKPVTEVVDQLEKVLDSHASVAGANSEAVRNLNRSFTAARWKLSAQRYETEARLNQSIANLYELQVRKSNITAERHHARSQQFFFGMLGAQLGVIISTFAIAARKHNVLWSLAAAAGLIAVAFAIYVYLYV